MTRTRGGAGTSRDGDDDLPPPPHTTRSGNDGTTHGDPTVYGGSTARACIERRSWTRTVPTLGTRTKSV